MHFKSEKGNALFLILIAVVLFAALSYAVTSSMRGGGKDASEDQLNLYASTVTQYATAIESAIMRIRVSNYCNDDEISFEHDANGDGNWFDTADEYHNPNSPPDLRCHVFHPNGGGAIYLASPPNTINTYPYIYTTNSIRKLSPNVPFVGSGERELILLLRITPSQSEAFRKMIGQSSVGESGGGNNIAKFIGVYGPAGLDINNGGFGSPQTLGMSGVFCDGAGGTPCSAIPSHFFYHVLIAR